MVRPTGQCIGIGPVPKVVAVVELRRDAAGLPFRMSIHKLLELPVGDQILVEEKITYRDGMFRYFVL
jgi:hypothetical protein